MNKKTYEKNNNKLENKDKQQEANKKNGGSPQITYYS